ncbi:MAG: 1,2-diacylglycerol 3-alpha-glucosyltransferase [Mycobacterium sp.]|nr:1,2-diacylglycerol 3-alpha-glucosyltransferase [Mycobacterium sp.]
MTSNSPRLAASSTDPGAPRDPVVARSLIGLPSLPTIVAMGPFDDRSEAEELAEAFTAVRRRCVAQLVLFGTGPQRTTIVRRAFAHGVGSDVHPHRNFPAGRWSDVLAAADVVVPSTASGSMSLLNALSACRPVVAPIDPTTMRLVVPTSAGLVYRPGDVSGMAAALLRLLTTPALRHGMACRAGEVALRHPLLIRLQQSTNGSNDA